MERIKFARSDHEYLIDYCQFDNEKIIYNSNNKIKIDILQKNLKQTRHFVQYFLLASCSIPDI